MEVLSMTAAAHRAERLRQVRRLANELAPGRQRDALHDQLDTEASALASSKLAPG